MANDDDEFIQLPSLRRHFGKPSPTRISVTPTVMSNFFDFLPLSHSTDQWHQIAFNFDTARSIHVQLVKNVEQLSGEHGLLYL